MPWTQETVAGKAVDFYTPEAGPARFAVLHLHGVGRTTLANNPSYTAVLEELGLACACPHGQRSWWSDRICPEFDAAMTAERFLLDQVVPFMRDRWALGADALGISGISMGGQGALRLAFKHPQQFPVVAAVSSAIDYHQWYGEGAGLDDMYQSSEDCRQDSVVLHIHPSKHPSHILFVIDPDDLDWTRGNDRLHEKLAAIGIPHEIDFTTRAGGHSWDYFNFMAGPTLRFIHTGLSERARQLI